MWKGLDRGVPIASLLLAVSLVTPAFAQVRIGVTVSATGPAASLGGGGTVQTSDLDLKDFPPLEKMVDLTKLQFLDNPGLDALRAAFQIRQGRLFVQPFDVKLGETTMNVSGSNGLDQSLQYTLSLRVPRSMMGGGANQAIAGLVSRAGAAGVDLSAAPEIALGLKLGGTVTSPSVTADVGSLATSVKEGTEKALREAATQKVDSAAARLIAEAEQKAASIRQEAKALADKVKTEGYQQADSLTAAKPAADELRKQADGRAAGIIGEANKRADGLIAEARRKAGQPAARSDSSP